MSHPVLLNFSFYGDIIKFAEETGCFEMLANFFKTNSEYLRSIDDAQKQRLIAAISDFESSLFIENITVTPPKKPIRR